MRIRIYDYPTGHDFDRTVECSKEEWNRLTQSARRERLPIDGATVDENLLNDLMDRPAVRGKAAKSYLSYSGIRP